MHEQIDNWENWCSDVHEPTTECLVIQSLHPHTREMTLLVGGGSISRLESGSELLHNWPLFLDSVDRVGSISKPCYIILIPYSTPEIGLFQWYLVPEINWAKIGKFDEIVYDLHIQLLLI